MHPHQNYSYRGLNDRDGKNKGTCTTYFSKRKCKLKVILLRSRGSYSLKAKLIGGQEK